MKQSKLKIGLFICTSLLIASLLIGINTSAQQKVSSTEMNTLKEYAVVPFADTLFVLSGRSGSFSAKERAIAVTKRIQNLAIGYDFKKKLLQLVEEENNLDIVYGENIIIRISDSDALSANKTRQQFAELLKQQIGDAVVRNKEARSLYSKIIRGAQFIGMLILIVLVLFFINKFFQWLAVKIKALKKGDAEKEIYNHFRLLPTEEHISILFTFNRFIKLLTIILVLFFAVPLLFGIFPQTSAFADFLFALIIVPAKNIMQMFWNYLPKLSTIFVIITVFYFILRGLQFVKKEIERGVFRFPGFHKEWSDPTYQIIRVLIYALVLVIIYPYLPGSGSAVFNGVTIFIGALATFGSSNSLGNIVSGLALTYMRSFKDGDRIKIGDVTGDIVEKNLLVTRVRTIKNEVISIPNSNVLNNHTINFSKDATDKGLILHTTITIGYDVPWKTVHELAIKAALAVKRFETEPAPFIYQTSLDDFYVSYQVNAYTRHPNDQASIYSELHQNILDQFNKAGVEILSPHYRALRDGNSIAAPSENIPAGYEIPAFRVTNDPN